MTRLPRAAVPAEAAARAACLYGVWQGVDDWLEQRDASAGTASGGRPAEDRFA